MSLPLYQTANSSTSTLRPRTSRLISYLDDDTSEPEPSARPYDPQLNDAVGSLSSGATIQPLTRARSDARDKAALKGKDAHTRSNSEHASVAPGPSFWEPWSSLSGIASTILGNDVPASQKGKRRAGHEPIPRLKDHSSKHFADWGPSPSTSVSAVDPLIEERLSLLQAKKREVILAANASAGRDILGRYKRRDSTTDVVQDDSHHETEALVYVHEVKRGDTMAGVTIRYGCAQEVFRKVNRFWPNDSIETRKHVLLPVDSCSIRSKKMNDLELLSSDLQNAAVLSSEPRAESASIQGNPPETTSSPSLLPSPTTLIEDSKHESWVRIQGFVAPVEILRLPRRLLAYFPPPRRKSITDVSETSTPKTSLDMLRHPPTHAASLNASPVRRAQMNYQSARQRSTSSVSPSLFTDHLSGPGGVGTLRGLRTEPSRPGPASDPLNRKFAQYLPDLAPPEAFPRTSLRPTPRATPRASTDSMRSTSSAGLGDVGGAIEGWVRKMANTKSGKASAKMGDLIELEITSEGGDLLKDEDGEQTPVAADSARMLKDTSEQALLDERFPMRGRVRNAYEANGK